MTTHVSTWALAVCLLTAAGCATDVARPAAASPQAELMERLDEGIARLTSSIEGLDRRMATLQSDPADDPMLRELESLDRSAWQLRRQQWVLQRDHLRFARQLLSQARNEGTSQLADRWAEHEADYGRQLEELRQRRYDFERDRIKVEGELIKRHLQ